MLKKFDHSRKHWNFKTAKEVKKPIRKKIYSDQKLNQLSKIYKMNFTNWKANKQKEQNFVLPSDGSWRAKNFLKLFSKYLKERKCKIKQDLNLFDDKSEHSSIPTDILNLQKNSYEKFYTKHFSQIRNRKNISNEQFHLCETKIL